MKTTAHNFATLRGTSINMLLSDEVERRKQRRLQLSKGAGRNRTDGTSQKESFKTKLK
jgi:hypothetical protein